MSQQPADSLRQIPVYCAHSSISSTGLLIPHPRNPNRHPKKQIELLSKIIAHNGWRSPICVSKRSGFVIKGHARLEAAKVLNAPFVPIDFQDYETEAQEWSDMVADNKIQELADSDDELIKQLAQELGPDFDPMLFGDPDLAFDLGLTITEENQDVVPESVPERCKSGDLWTLGQHRLLCADACLKENVSILMPGSSATLMVTDPPYGVNYDASWREGADLVIGKRSKGKVTGDGVIDWSAALKHFLGDIAYVWHASQYSHIVAKALIDLEYQIVSQLIWVKQHFAMSRGDYHWQHEPCWYAVRKGKPHNWQGARDQSTIWQIANNNAFGGEGEEKFGHSTQKPVECMARAIKNNSKLGDTVYDPFCGSGSTLIAAEKLGRKCMAIEIEPRYCDIILQRYEILTGKTPEKCG